MRAHDNLGLAADDLQQGTLVQGSAQLAGEQGQPELICQLVAKSVSNRAHMLGSQYLGGGQQRRLSAALCNREHCPNRNQSFARTNLTLKHAVHRVVLPEIFEQFVADRNLPGCQFKRQLGIETGKQLTGDSRRGGDGCVLASALEQCRLQQEGLVKTKGVTRRLPLVVILWSVNKANRLIERKQTIRFNNFGWQLFCDWRQDIEQDPDRATNHPCGDFRRSWINRNRQLGPTFCIGLVDVFCE